ncbi:hypothetical protein [Streptomyces sp. NPDC051636]|uniref:hypothetical protein n=1 Tax=Streptomyces sp. NPDC051636 TaxID=3365663 RepID=UPI00379513A0
MTTQHIGGVGGPPCSAERDRRAWVAPLIATVLLGLLGPLAAILGGLSAMATDSCGPDDCSPALTTSLSWIYTILFFGGWVSFAALVTAWVLPWNRRWRALRLWSAVAMPVPPLAVLFLVFTLPAP